MGVRGGRPFKVIASLELLAVLYGVVLLVPRGDYGDGLARVPFSGGTDNQGNEQLVKKMTTTKFPVWLVAVELASQLSSRHLDLHLARRLDATRVAQQFMVMNELEPATREWRRQRQGQAKGKAGQP